MSDDLDRRVQRMLTAIDDATPLAPELDAVMARTAPSRSSRSRPLRSVRAVLLATAGVAIGATLVIAIGRDDPSPDHLRGTGNPAVESPADSSATSVAASSIETTPIDPSIQPTTVVPPMTEPYVPFPVAVSISDSTLQLPNQAVPLQGYSWSYNSRPSSGLARPDFFDWPATVEAVLPPLPAAAPIVVALGSNDAQELSNVDGTVVGFDDPQWPIEYGRRVGALMDQILASGHPLVWVGVADSRSAELSNGLSRVRDATMAAAVTRPAVRYVDAWVIFAPDGVYTPTIDIDGVRTQVRSPVDDFHFNQAGLDVLGAAIAEQLVGLGIPPAETNKNGSTPPQPTGPFALKDETSFTSTWTASPAAKDPTVVVLSLVGGPPYDDSNFCSVRYRAEINETVDAVTVKIFAAQATTPPANPETGLRWACPMLGYPHYIGVRLANPLDARPVIDELTGAAVGPATIPDLPIAIIQPGDDLSTLIERTGASVEELIAQNHWTSGAGQPLPPGEVIFLPATAN